MQVMNRYMSIGVDATLITLTTGALIGVLAEYYIRKARQDLCAYAALDYEQEQSKRLLRSLNFNLWSVFSPISDESYFQD